MLHDLILWNMAINAHSLKVSYVYLIIFVHTLFFANFLSLYWVDPNVCELFKDGLEFISLGKQSAQNVRFILKGMLLWPKKQYLTISQMITSKQKKTI